MGEAKRRKQAASSVDPEIADYLAVEKEARGIIVRNILATTRSPMLRRMYRQLMEIDRSGKLLCAYCQYARDMTDHVLARKRAGQSDVEIERACNRDLSMWLAKGPKQIIAEFDEGMRVGVFGPPVGAPRH